MFMYVCFVNEKKKTILMLILCYMYDAFHFFWGLLKNMYEATIEASELKLFVVII